MKNDNMKTVQKIDKETVTDENRLSYYIQVLSSYRNLNEVCPGGFTGAMIAMASGVGRITGEPFDESSLAEALGISRTTLGRKVKLLEKAGYVRLHREGRRNLILSVYERYRENPQEDEFMVMIDELIRSARARLASTSRQQSS